MLTNRSDVPVRGESSWRFLVPGAIAGVAALGFLTWLVAQTPWVAHSPAPAQPTTAGIGLDFMSRYILPFEAVSVLLLVAMIGATYVARSREEREPELTPEEIDEKRKEGGAIR